MHSLLCTFATIYFRYDVFRAFFSLKSPFAVMLFAQWTPYLYYTSSKIKTKEHCFIQSLDFSELSFILLRNSLAFHLYKNLFVCLFVQWYVVSCRWRMQPPFCPAVTRSCSSPAVDRLQLTTNSWWKNGLGMMRQRASTLASVNRLFPERDRITIPLL
jgi:hypothetical protein